MSIEAMKQALEDIQQFKSLWIKVPAFGNKVNKATREAVSLAHNPIFQIEHDLRQAIAEAEKQEPFGFAVLNEVTEQFNSMNCGTVYRLPAEGRSPLYTTQQQRKPLTEREILDFWLARFNVEGSPINNFARAIEAAHSIKE